MATRAEGNRTRYKAISGNSAPEFSTELGKATSDGWKPILLTSAVAATPDGEIVKIVAIVEK